jgi:V8-like Glu-specific endopeptidase
MTVNLSKEDFQRLVRILSGEPQWQSVSGRNALLLSAFAGSPRKADFLENIDRDGPPGQVATLALHSLLGFGQDEPGREVVGVLINQLIERRGGGDDVEFLAGLLRRYPFVTNPVATRPIDAWKGTKSYEEIREKIIGENTLKDISFLERLVELAKAVVRIQGPIGSGTGFLVAENLLMTNHHVIDSQATANDCTFQFNYQLDRNGKLAKVHATQAALNGIFHTSPDSPQNATSEQLDYTIVQVDNPPPGVSPLRLRSSEIDLDGRVTIIQHPAADYKKISLQNNFVEYVDSLIVQYTTSTEPGSSGAPVFDDGLSVVAIHHHGGDLTEPRTRRRYLRNEGVRITAILHNLELTAPEIYRALTKP